MRTGAGRVAGLLAAVASVVLADCSSATTGTSHRERSSTTATSPTPTTPASTPAITAGSTPTWLTYGGNFARTAVDATDPARTAAPRALWTSPALDGPVYGEPLVSGGTVYVATEHDTVYALTASRGEVAWSLHLGSPASAGALPCGDITPDVGITSTMVIDAATQTLFASAETSSGAGLAHVLVAIDLSTHRVRWSRSLDQPGWSSAAQLQRTALAIASGDVLAGFGGHYGDCGSYHGWVVGVPESGSGTLEVYRVPSANEGAVWAPSGVAVDGSGDVYVATGNGGARPGQAFDHGNSVIELSPQLAERQYFAPSSWAQDNASDADLGSTSPVLLGDGEVFEVGKSATAYLLGASALGGIGGQQASLRTCNSRGGSAYLAPDAYVVCSDDAQVEQVRVGPGTTLAHGWTWTSPTGGVGSPTIAGGVLWSIDAGAQKLYGVDLGTGTTRYVLNLGTGTPTHFAAPAAAAGMIVVAGSRAVEAFG